jgi:gas vesicle protein
MAERDEFGAFLLGFIVGGLTGAVASLLLAPQSGESTRTLLKEKAIELGDQVNVSVDEARTRAESVTAEARARAETITAEARVRADEIVKQARVKAEELQVKAEELQKRGQVALEEQRSKIVETVKKASDGAAAAETPAE